MSSNRDSSVQQVTDLSNGFCTTRMHVKSKIWENLHEKTGETGIQPARQLLEIDRVKSRRYRSEH
jgi:hypothetical protein